MAHTRGAWIATLLLTAALFGGCGSASPKDATGVGATAPPSTDAPPQTLVAPPATEVTTAPDVTSPVTTTALAGGDSPTRMDFSTNPARTDPNSQPLSWQQLADTRRSISAGPTAIRGFTALSIYEKRDGSAVTQNFDDPSIGRFWLEEYQTNRTIADVPARCVRCDQSSSGRVSIAPGTIGIIWYTGTDPTVVIWWTGPVEHDVVGPATLTRENALKIAATIAAS